ncbi:terminase large subunit [Flavobacterium sp.]|uniref:PBSX family phage terminase large subunit n=1 Tax=Flavobacterium sp. TaxID=239 RepID=UPI0033407823
MTKFVKGIQGGTSSGKTFAVIPILIDIAAKNKLSEISVVAESIPHLKRGAMKDFKKIMIETGRWVDSRWNATDFKYNFSNGSQIEFFSADNDSKLRGARRDYLYMNEANNMTFHAYTELASRTKKGVYLDWNPVNEFWFHTDLQNDNDVDFIIVTYEDNEACPESALNFILKAKEKAKTSSYWENWYKVYGLGQIGTLEGVIFNNWQSIDTIPNDARLIGYGIDFGYSNDPTAIVEVYKWNDKRIVNEICYQKELSNSQISKFITSKLPTYCDSAEPKSIAELTKLGVRAFGVTKGSDSINFGIQTMQGQEYLVTKQSTNLINELRKYAWDKDKKTGATLNKPIDMYNHAIDAFRYHEMETIGLGKSKGKLMFG